LATLSIRDAYEVGRPDLGVAAVMSALPLMMPLVILLMHKFRTTEVQL
jgi:multiple sugar transport system permease protein